jgi:hypothetical protein
MLVKRRDKKCLRAGHPARFVQVGPDHVIVAVDGLALDS